MPSLPHAATRPAGAKKKLEKEEKFSAKKRDTYSPSHLQTQSLAFDIVNSEAKGHVKSCKLEERMRGGEG
jgi:hypothetical protein